MRHKIKGQDIIFTLDQDIDNNEYMRLMAHRASKPDLKWCLLMIHNEGHVIKIGAVTPDLGLNLNENQALEIEEV